MGDRPEPGLVKWSPNAHFDSFLHINLTHRIIQLYEPTGHARTGRFDWKKSGKHDDVPPLTTYDWSPSIPGLVAVGTSTGVVNLLRVDDGSNAYLELNLKMSRTCQAVAFSTIGKLAVGLERVRNDNSLYIWDVNRLSSLDSNSHGFPADMAPFSEPRDRLEASVSVSSVKFFEDNPNLLVAGIKGQGLRIHDLRDRPHGAAISMQTKCCNNLAIDYADPNYFASSALDHPGVMVWDRRATSRAAASHSYLEAVDQDDVPWGGALRLNRAMQMETDPAAMDSHSSFIRSLRFCRDHPGMLAILSRTGQLKVLSTKNEFSETDMTFESSPQLLEVTKSHEMDPHYADTSRKNDKIVSFDWVTMSSPAIRPRLLVLRANGAFEILEKPSFTAEYPYKLIPWQAPHRGLEEHPYHALMEFEPSQAPGIVGPLFTESLLSDVPLFGPEKADVETLVKEALQLSAQYEDLVVDEAAANTPRLDLRGAVTVADKLKALRQYSQEHLSRPQSRGRGANGKDSPKQADMEPKVQRERHERVLSEKMESLGLPSEGHEILDHIMLLRAKEKYLFGTETNQRVVADDPWLQDVWGWVAGAEDAAADGGMMSHPLDVSYMGVYSIWMNDLGSKPNTRLAEGSIPPDVLGWERCMNAICKSLNIPKFDGVETRWPNHRALCLDICSWGRQPSPLYDAQKSSDASWPTMTAARALFKGDTKEAVDVLKKASVDHPHLLFVSLALQMAKNHESGSKDKDTLDFDAAVPSQSDPYLRAISSVIATGDWTSIANQKSLPLRDRVYVAVRHFRDGDLTDWLRNQVSEAIHAGDIEGIVLTGITDPFVDILARYVTKFHDYQTATLLLSTCAPRFLDDIRATAFRNAYRAHLQRHHAFFHRTKFEVESTKRSKHLGRPTILPAGRQIGLRCVYCDAEMSLLSSSSLTMLSRASPSAGLHVGQPNAPPPPPKNASGNLFTEKMVAAGISCPNCKRHLPRCAVCLEIVGLSNKQGQGQGQGQAGGGGGAGNFPTFCLKCEHVLHLDHARQWFARHQECPVPECRCKCNFRANPELNYH
ncbi:hypothetical protein CONLIGDRAFT_201545 [Coniochaeta ligniaria NRRL 30616]|uniref:Uncharacterized protein n=1 Tax=Coniochaeta ligniaria NRRL 30616 TaxID=1408157 RepID=A0A1J7J1L0_9PEZI|nr:hypothetical protein CONLIGDRAFT_201545 [Coniochaeta ligniaria NRRL 30616]